MLTHKRILLILTGGIAAYKGLDLIRRLRALGAQVTPVLTRAAEQFVTPLAVSALAGQKVYRDLFDLTDEAEMGHIQLIALSRSDFGGPRNGRHHGKDGAGAG